MPSPSWSPFSSRGPRQPSAVGVAPDAGGAGAVGVVHPELGGVDAVGHQDHELQHVGQVGVASRDVGGGTAGEVRTVDLARGDEGSTAPARGWEGSRERGAPFRRHVDRPVFGPLGGQRVDLVLERDGVVRPGRDLERLFGAGTPTSATSRRRRRRGARGLFV